MFDIQYTVEIDRMDNSAVQHYYTSNTTLLLFLSSLAATSILRGVVLVELLY